MAPCARRILRAYIALRPISAAGSPEGAMRSGGRGTEGAHAGDHARKSPPKAQDCVQVNVAPKKISCVAGKFGAADFGRIGGYEPANELDIGSYAADSR